MIFLIGCGVILVIAGVAIFRSKKPLKLILAETKYEILYNIMGSKYMMHDIIMKRKNKTEFISKPGKVAVITGGTRGIGLEVIRILLKCDVTVIIGCRNVEKGKELLKIFRADDIKTGNIDVFQLDISYMNSVRKFAKAVSEKYQKIHYLINNAGIMFGPHVESRDGYESQFATNHLGHFLLTHLLLPQLIDAGEENSFSRIVNVSSCAHEAGDINFEDINHRSQYIAAAAYAQSKLAQVLFSNYLDKLLKKENLCVQVHSVHPGIVDTELFDGTRLKNLAPWVPSLFFKTPKKGALPIIHAVLSSRLEGKGGTYIHNCRVYPTSLKAASVELQEKLFDFSKNLLKIEKFGKLF